MTIFQMNEEILPPSDDYIFKAILTNPNAKAALMDLISAVIGRKVINVEIRNNEIPVTDNSEKNERLDINCLIDDGSQVNVEMQASVTEGADNGHLSFINKIIYYLADLHSSQKSKGIKFSELVRTYQITFSTHNVLKTQNYLTEASLRTSDGIPFSDQINIIVIELGKFEEVLKKSAEEMTDIERWSVFLGYANDPKYRPLMNEIFEQSEAIDMAGTALTAISKDENERAKFLSRKKYEMEMTSNMLEREAKGRKKERAENIRKLKQSAIMSNEQIAQILGISIAEVEQL